MPLGGLVGYSVRFDDKTSKDTRIKFLTDGMLLRECMLDPKLENYKVVILDEAHERSINTDILCALLATIQKQHRPDLRIIIMSATLDADLFQRHFKYVFNSFLLFVHTHSLQCPHILVRRFYMYKVDNSQSKYYIPLSQN